MSEPDPDIPIFHEVPKPSPLLFQRKPTNPNIPTKHPRYFHKEREESPLGHARRLADMELRGTATLEDIAWLFNNPVLWLRALAHMQADIRHRMNLKRLELSKHKPLPGAKNNGMQLRLYEKLKHEFDQSNGRRADIIRRIERKIEQAKELFGVDNVLLTGDLIFLMTRIAQLAEDDDIESVKSVATFYADQWGRTRQIELKKGRQN